jgi:hypothetical protein
VGDGPRAAGDNPSADVEDNSLEAAPNRLRLQAYLSLMLLIPALFLASSIPIVRSKSFPIESGDPFLLNPDYAFSLHHVDCDVVIYGDSTALTGLDPGVVSHATGLKTCNIAQAQSIVDILGMLALDTYLKNNAPPKYIVMQFAPETLSRDRSNFFWPEGLTLLLRKRSLLQASPTFIRHPVEAYHFSIWAIKVKITSLIDSPVDFASTQAIFRSHGGLLILPKPPETHCLNDIAYTPPSVDWVRTLRERYASNRTRVLINVSPLPNCSPIAAPVAAGMRNVTDNSLSLYPVGLFCDLDRHLTLEGAERASLELGEQLSAGQNIAALRGMSASIPPSFHMTALRDVH